MSFSKYAKIRIVCWSVTLILAWSSSSRADFGIVLSSGGFLGEQRTGVTVCSVDCRQHFSLSFGFTRDELVGSIRQYSLQYRYQPWTVGQALWTWRPLAIGLFLTYTDHPDFFFEPDNRYPESYYDSTALRFGVQLTSLIGRRFQGGDVFSVGGYLSYLDQGLNQLWNNGWTEASPHFASVGVMVEWSWTNP